jgi:hypothetical protein
MSIEEFIAIDPYAPQDTEKELEFFIPRFKGMRDWEIHPDGDVVIKYDDGRISGELIEEVLERNGFHVKHIMDQYIAGEVQALKAFYLQSGHVI